ncbi:MAG TPA: hypothetical protein VFI16_06995 [Anaeromyxobacteraceae bacterium]|nr:hypothetical protein [Anaeromyxobacteraceae bacterium]
MRLEIADVQVVLALPRADEAPARRRYHGFIRPGAAPDAPPALRLTAAPGPDHGRGVATGPARLVARSVDARTIQFHGDCRGTLDVERGIGRIDHGQPLESLDALLRLGLAAIAPARGWLLLHGAAIDLRDGAGLALLGASGAGKSTAAATFESRCDDLVLVAPRRCGVEIAGTPYWRGRPGTAPGSLIVCLEKGGRARARRLRPVEALRAIARHVIRFCAVPATDALALAVLRALASEVPVLAVSCPEGPEYLPFLAGTLADFGVFPRWRARRSAGCR